MLKSLIHGVMVGAVVALAIANAKQSVKIGKLEVENIKLDNRIEATRWIMQEVVRERERTGTDFIRLLKVIGEVYGLETESETCRLIYWTQSITNGMPYAECRQRIRNGLDGKKVAK